MDKYKNRLQIGRNELVKPWKKLDNLWIKFK